jgi:hypothetical protein
MIQASQKKSYKSGVTLFHQAKINKQINSTQSQISLAFSIAFVNNFCLNIFVNSFNVFVYFYIFFWTKLDVPKLITIFLDIFS